MLFSLIMILFLSCRAILGRMAGVLPTPCDAPQPMNPDHTQLLQCPLCNSAYNNVDHKAKLLSCHHSFCIVCLSQLITDTLAIKCPLCHKETALPEEGIAELQNNFYIDQMRDMIVAPLVKKKPSGGPTCKKHTNQALLFYCDTCTVPICMNCTVLDHDKNLGHSIKDISAAVSVHQQLLESKLAKASNAIEQRHSLLTQLKTEMGNLDIAKNVSMERLNETFEQLKTKLDQRQKELTDKITEHYESRRGDIIEKALAVKSDSKNLNAMMQQYTDLINEGQSLAIIKAATDGESLRQMNDISQQLSLNQPAEGFIEFDYKAGLTNFVECMGKLGSVRMKRALPSVVDVQECDAITSNLATFCVTAHSCGKQALDSYPLSVDIIDPCKDTLVTKMQSEGNGVYTVRFRPQMPGNHSMNILFLGHPISDTARTFRVQSNNPLLRIGEEGSADGQMLHPTSVAIAPNSNIYVADMGNKRIQVFNKKGKFITQFKVGAAKSTTYDIAINPANQEVLCTKVAPDQHGNMTADSVRFFGLGGEKLRQFLCKGMSNGLFITVNSKSKIIVTDASENCIFIFSKDGSLLKKFGGPGNKPGHFNFPAAVCVGKNDEIFISDTKNHRVQVFSHEGIFTHQFGCQGNMKGQFHLPRGIAADHHGYVLVADSHNKIQVFRYDGTFVSCIDSKCDPVSDPYNMAVTQDGCVFIADFKNNCVKKYQYL